MFDRREIPSVSGALRTFCRNGRRHTCAMIVLQATQDIRKVSLSLGHSSMETTEMYTHADPTQKMEAIHAITPPKLRRGCFRPSDKLIALLKAESLCGVKNPKVPAVTTP